MSVSFSKDSGICAYGAPLRGRTKSFRLGLAALAAGAKIPFYGTHQIQGEKLWNDAIIVNVN